MQTKDFQVQDFFYFFRAIESEKVGFYFSFLLHLVFLIFVIGFPDFFKTSKINIPTIIPIEIINVSDTTSIPEKIEEIKDPKEIIKKPEIIEKPKIIEKPELIEKPKIIEEPKIVEKPKITKFNNVQKEISKSIVVKDKPEIEKKNIIDIKEDKNLVDMKVDPIDIDNNKKQIVEEQFESLPSKKIKPKIKPKKKNIEVSEEQDMNVPVKVLEKPKPNFNIASMLKDLRNDKSLTESQKNPNESKKENMEENKLNEQSKAQLSISEIDLLIQQLSSCWTAPLGAVIEQGMVVKVAAKIKPDKKALYETVRIVDTNISQSNPFYGPITESAMRTLLHPECNPLKLPDNKYDLWKNLTIIFDHSIMKGY